MNFLSRLIDSLKTKLKLVNYGHVIILIGQRGTGKSETIKTLCNSISGMKYVVRFDSELNPLSMHDDDERDYEKLPGCHIIENDEEFTWEPGLFIMEDFPSLSESAKQALYNQIKDARHTQLNFLIIAHDYNVLKDTVFRHANSILLFRDSSITEHQLAPRLGGTQAGGLQRGHAIRRALADLKQYHYRLVSFDNNKWIQHQIDSRDASILKKIVRGDDRESDYCDIEYEKTVTIYAKTEEERETKRQMIQILLQQGDMNTDEIATAVNTTRDTVYKEKSNLKRYLIDTNGEDNIPHWLDDGRKKQSTE